MKTTDAPVEDFFQFLFLPAPPRGRPKGNHIHPSRCNFVVLKPTHKLVVRITLHGQVSNQFSDEVLAIESALPSTFIDSDAADLCLYFLTRDNLTVRPYSVAANSKRLIPSPCSHL